ncbi:MAG TPA: nuclear transport factor 2 family protein [Gemmatimonadaceae bacterium]|nr:nuclear transport factor 2 family protein [Gemmatimonadaceae bacterium]
MITATAPSTTSAVADELVAFCRVGKNMDAINSLYSTYVVSVESMGNEQMPREMKGIDAIRGKNQWWGENNEVHSANIEGPFVGNDDKFAVYYNYDVTSKPSGKRSNMEEMALYTVKDGKIVREQFFYRTS